MYLYEISQRNNYLVNAIINANTDMMYAGVVSGNNTGAVWADNISNPAFCVVWSEHLKGFHFMGKSYNHINKNDLRTFVENTMIPFLKNKDISYFEFSCDLLDWFPFICEILSAYDLKRYKQYFYKLKEIKNINKDINVPIGYDVFEINENFIHEKLKTIENPEIILSDIEETWGSILKFLEHGMGFLATQNNSICSFAATHFYYNNNHCIGVETFDPHKRKGLSSYLSATLINKIVENNGSVWWDCSADNIASQKTASKIGLAFSHEYEVFWFDV